MAQYAAKTEVTVDRSRSEIERTLARYGATAFMYGWDQTKAVVEFEADGRRIRFLLPLPDRNDPAFVLTPAKKAKRSPGDAEKAWEQACRQCWRALALVIKAKLEAVDAGISEFESEFLANVVLPNGATVGDFIRPQIASAYSGGGMPQLAIGAG